MNQKLKHTLALMLPLSAGGIWLAVAVAQHDHDHDDDHAPATAAATAPAPAHDEHAARADEHGKRGEHGHDHGAETKTKHEHPPAKKDQHGHEQDHGDEHAKPTTAVPEKPDAHGHLHDDGDAPAAPETAMPGKPDAHGHVKPDPHGHGHTDAHGGEAHVDEHGHGHADEHGHGEHAPGEHADEVTLTPEAIRRYGITVAPAARQALSPTFMAPGRVSFNTEAMAHVGSVLTGRITQLKAKLGDTVAEGDELFVIESPELAEAQSEFLQQRTAVAVARSAVEPARLAYERARGLYDKNEAIALGEVQKREAEWKAAQGALATAEAALAAAENKLHAMGFDQAAVEALAKTGDVSPRSSVRAPLAGTVVEREVTLGELVHPERDALMVLANTDALWVIADVPEARLADVRPGSKARVRIAAFPDKTFDGAVTYISPALNPDTRTAGVRIEVRNADGLLRPGMFARAELSAGSEGEAGEAVLVVPREAVQTVEGEPSVFVPVDGEPDTFAKRAVKVGQPVGGFVPVLDGLTEGQPVVTAGAFILKADLGKSGAGHGH